MYKKIPWLRVISPMLGRGKLILSLTKCAVLPRAAWRVNGTCSNVFGNRILAREVVCWLCQYGVCVYWLPIRQQIVFKLATVTYKPLLFGLPAYLQCEIHDYHPSRTLCLTSALLLQQQPATISFATRAFCAAAPTVWNSVGVHTHLADMFLTFKNRLKTELFKPCY